jgi:predicted signal transduction protein with EAL and GGDEF domain
VGLGRLEIYLSYRPIAGAVSHDERTIAVLVALGLALLWGVLFRIVASASKRLRRQAQDNDRLARYDQLTGLPNRTLHVVAEGIETTEVCERLAAMGCNAGQGYLISKPAPATGLTPWLRNRVGKSRTEVGSRERSVALGVTGTRY